MKSLNNQKQLEHQYKVLKISSGVCKENLIALISVLESPDSGARKEGLLRWKLLFGETDGIF